MVDSAHMYISRFKAAKTSLEVTRLPDLAEQWIPPKHMYIKVSVDAFLLLILKWLRQVLWVETLLGLLLLGVEVELIMLLVRKFNFDATVSRSRTAARFGDCHLLIVEAT